jgi:hypothetical protein
LGICIAPTQPFRAALGAESRVCYPGNTADRQTMSAHLLPPLAVNSKSERKVNSLPPLGFELVIIGMLTHLSNHSTKSPPSHSKLCPRCGPDFIFNFILCARLYHSHSSRHRHDSFLYLNPKAILPNTHGSFLKHRHTNRSEDIGLHG